MQPPKGCKGMYLFGLFINNHYDRDVITHTQQAKLEQNLDELEDSVERERKVRGKKDGIFISVF